MIDYDVCQSCLDVSEPNDGVFCEFCNCCPACCVEVGLCWPEEDGD